MTPGLAVVPTDSADPPTEPEPEPITFDDFWAMYPRKIEKVMARKAWSRIDPAMYPVILAALYDWRRVWKDWEPNYIIYPERWLKRERWEDELPPGFRKTTANPLRIVQVEPSTPAVRVPMPEHVKTLLASLKRSK